MEKPKVSVIIPVYNAEKTLNGCLKSILRQKYDNFEVIVVDNNSTDSSKQIIIDLQKRHKNLKYLFESVRKRGAARNTGEKAAKGDIVLMTDSDCIVPSDWIKNMIRPILNGEADAVQGFETSATADFWSKQKQRRSEEKFNNVEESFVVGHIDTKNFAISMKALKKIGLTSRKHFSGNDTDLGIRLQKNNLNTKMLNDVRVKHFHPNSFWKVVRKGIYRGSWSARITKDHEDYLKQTKFPEQTCQTFISFFRFFPGLLKALIIKGPEYTYYELVVGLSWRIGLLYGWIKIALGLF